VLPDGPNPDKARNWPIGPARQPNIKVEGLKPHHSPGVRYFFMASITRGGWFIISLKPLVTSCAEM
jgi:hypothetical protein